ncbi:hypothetical protein GWI33_011045, partial [Rhynchophorus ferrugineus]
GAGTVCHSSAHVRPYVGAINISGPRRGAADKATWSDVATPVNNEPGTGLIKITNGHLPMRDLSVSFLWDISKVHVFPQR